MTYSLHKTLTLLWHLTSDVAYMGLPKWLSLPFTSLLPTHRLTLYTSHCEQWKPICLSIPCPLCLSMDPSVYPSPLSIHVPTKFRQCPDTSINVYRWRKILLYCVYIGFSQTPLALLIVTNWHNKNDRPCRTDYQTDTLEMSLYAFNFFFKDCIYIVTVNDNLKCGERVTTLFPYSQPTLDRPSILWLQDSFQTWKRELLTFSFFILCVFWPILDDLIGLRKKSWIPERVPTVFTLSVRLSVRGYRTHLLT